MMRQFTEHAVLHSVTERLCAALVMSRRHCSIAGCATSTDRAATALHITTGTHSASRGHRADHRD